MRILTAAIAISNTALGGLGTVAVVAVIGAAVNELHFRASPAEDAKMHRRHD